MDIKGFEPLTFSMQSRRSTTDLNALVWKMENYTYTYYDTLPEETHLRTPATYNCSTVVFTNDDPVMSVLQVEVTCHVVRPERYGRLRYPRFWSLFMRQTLLTRIHLLPFFTTTQLIFKKLFQHEKITKKSLTYLTWNSIAFFKMRRWTICCFKSKLRTHLTSFLVTIFFLFLYLSQI